MNFVAIKLFVCPNRNSNFEQYLINRREVYPFYLNDFEFRIKHDNSIMYYESIFELLTDELEYFSRLQTRNNLSLDNIIVLQDKAFFLEMEMTKVYGPFAAITRNNSGEYALDVSKKVTILQNNIADIINRL